MPRTILGMLKLCMLRLMQLLSCSEQLTVQQVCLVSLFVLAEYRARTR